jgi:hypothetical protein
MEQTMHPLSSSLRPFVPPSLRSSAFFLFAAAASFLAGCCETVHHYDGPTEPMAQVVAAINANNSKVPALWSRHNYDADFVDDKHQSHHVGGDGVLLYIAPASMRFRAEAPIVGTVFEIGSNPQTFWLKLGPQTGDTMWWGRWADLPRMNPDDIGIPIRPDMVLDVLGIATINTNFNELPVPIMRFDTVVTKENNGAYVFIWAGKLPDRWVALREVWYDRVTRHPTRVLLYNMNGRVVLRATLSDFRRVAVEGMAKDQWPEVPGKYDLTFVESGSRLSFTLEQPVLKHQESPDKPWLPDPRSFRMPDPDTVDVKRVIQIGKQAE